MKNKMKNKYNLFEIDKHHLLKEGLIYGIITLTLIILGSAIINGTFLK